jgi:hypothetical protein
MLRGLLYKGSKEPSVNTQPATDRKKSREAKSLKDGLSNHKSGSKVNLYPQNLTAK